MYQKAFSFSHVIFFKWLSILIKPIRDYKLETVFLKLNQISDVVNKRLFHMTNANKILKYFCRYQCFVKIVEVV